MGVDSEICCTAKELIVSSYYAYACSGVWKTWTAALTARAGGAQVGTGYFDAVSTVVTAGASSTLALTGSTENAQFH